MATTKVHETTYVGRLYIRPIGRGIVLEETEGQPYVDDWLEHALGEAGVLEAGDEWTTSGRMTERVRLKLSIEHPPSDEPASTEP